MKNGIGMAAILGALVAAGCGGSNENNNYLPMTRKNVTSESVEKASKSLATGKSAKVLAGSTDFGFRLIRELGKGRAVNEFVSPVSVSTLLALAANGAGGGTKDAFDKVLGAESTLPNEVNQAYKDLQTTLVGADAKVEVDMANSVWVDRNFELKREFMARATDFYGAKSQALELSNPEAVTAINDWVKTQTENKIVKLFEKLDAGAKAVLVNAIHFKGKWTEPFDSKLTGDGEFRGADGKTRTVKLMRRSSEQFDYLKAEKFEAVRLPYGDGRVSMTIMLPSEKTSLTALTNELNAKNWAEWGAKFKAMAGNVTIPRWKVEAEYNLKPALTELGLGPAMDPQKADFSQLANVKAGELYISQIVHKAIIEVDEEGSEAAAATGAAISVTSAPMPTQRFEFVANRPFLYAISDKTTGAILFFGTISNL